MKPTNNTWRICNGMRHFSFHPSRSLFSHFLIFSFSQFQKHFSFYYFLILSISLLSSCNYDESLELCNVTVQLVYPEDSVDPYPGVRVELKDATASVFVDSTDAYGVARFAVPTGIYEASSSTQLIDSTGTTWWRYNFNGVRSMFIVAPDSANVIQLELMMSKKRIVH